LPSGTGEDLFSNDISEYLNLLKDEFFSGILRNQLSKVLIWLVVIVIVPLNTTYNIGSISMKEVKTSTNLDLSSI